MNDDKRLCISLFPGSGFGGVGFTRNKGLKLVQCPRKVFDYIAAHLLTGNFDYK